MISCEEAVDRLWHYLERELEEGHRAEIEQHLAFCRRCCGELEFAQELRAFLAEAARPRLPEEVEGRLLGFICELEDEAAAAGEGERR